MRDSKNFSEERKARWEARRARWNSRMEGRSRGSQVWTGLFILLIGVVALIKATVTNAPDWIFSWQMLLIAMGFFIGIRHGFRGAAWFILIMVGGVFLINEIYPDLTFRRYLWPMILIAIGAFIIFRPRRRWCRDDGIKDEEKKNISTSDSLIDPEPTYTKEDFVDSTSIFGGAKKIIISKNFRGGDLVNIFGGTELDLTQADFTGTAVIELTTIFGGTKLVVPSNWSVKSEAVTIFGGLEDKRNMQNLTNSPDKTLLLKGTVIFGGIDIKSF